MLSFPTQGTGISSLWCVFLATRIHSAQGHHLRQLWGLSYRPDVNGVPPKLCKEGAPFKGLPG